MTRRRTEKSCVICTCSFLAWDCRGITCSIECRKEHARRVERTRRGTEPIRSPETICDVCFGAFIQDVSATKKAKRCSDKCRREHQKKYGAGWMAANKDRHSESVRSWADRNPEKRREIGRNYARNNPVKMALKEVARRARKRGEGPFNKYHWAAVLDFFGHSCAYCHKSGELHADHVIPVSRLELGKVLAVENIVPACPRCNIQKNNKLLGEWRPELIEPLVAAVQSWNPGLANNFRMSK